MYDLEGYYQTIREGRIIGSSARRQPRPTLSDHRRAVFIGPPVSAETHDLIGPEQHLYLSGGKDHMLWDQNFPSNVTGPLLDRPSDNTLPPLPDALPDWLTDNFGKARKKTA